EPGDQLRLLLRRRLRHGFLPLEAVWAGLPVVLDAVGATFLFWPGDAQPFHRDGVHLVLLGGRSPRSRRRHALTLYPHAISKKRAGFRRKSFGATTRASELLSDGLSVSRRAWAPATGLSVVISGASSASSEPSNVASQASSSRKEASWRTPDRSSASRVSC